MYTSEIRETDSDGNPVAVSPALLAQVRDADDALREHLRERAALEYAGLWSFLDPNRAVLDLTLRVPILSEDFVVTVPFDPRRADRFAASAVQTALRHASEINQAKLSRQVRELVASTIEGE